MIERFAIFDTNVLPIGSDLASPLWLSIFRICAKSGIDACLPSIVVHESVNLRSQSYGEASASYLKAFKNLVRVYDLPAIYIPDTAEVSQWWEDELRTSFRIIEIEGEDAVEALEREANRQPPAREGKGARDSAIWLTARRMAESGAEVHLISRNVRDFGAGGEPGLHPRLGAELDGLRGSLHYHVGLDEFIEHVVTPSEKPALDPALVSTVLLDDVREVALQQLGPAQGVAQLSLDQISSVEVTLDSIAVLRAYAIDQTGLALIDGHGVLQLVAGQEDEVTRIGLSVRAWLEYDLAPFELLAGEVQSLSLGATIDAESEA